MEIFLIATSLVFFFFGSLFLLSPERVQQIARAVNRALLLFLLDDKIPRTRRLLGIFFLVLSIFLWYTALYKGNF